MLFWILAISIVFLIVGGFLCSFGWDCSIAIAAISFPTSLLVLVALVSFTEYVANVSYIAQADKLIAVRSEELSKLDEQFDKAMNGTPSVIHANADSPVASLVAARVKVAQALSKLRERKILKQIDVDAAQNGVWAPMYRLFAS